MSNYHNDLADLYGLPEGYSYSASDSSAIQSILTRGVHIDDRQAYDDARDIANGTTIFSRYACVRNPYDVHEQKSQDWIGQPKAKHSSRMATADFVEKPLEKKLIIRQYRVAARALELHKKEQKTQELYNAYKQSCREVLREKKELRDAKAELQTVRNEYKYEKGKTKLSIDICYQTVLPNFSDMSTEEVLSHLKVETREKFEAMTSVPKLEQLAWTLKNMSWHENEACPEQFRDGEWHTSPRDGESALEFRCYLQSVIGIVYPANAAVPQDENAIVPQDPNNAQADDGTLVLYDASQGDEELQEFRRKVRANRRFAQLAFYCYLNEHEPGNAGGTCSNTMLDFFINMVCEDPDFNKMVFDSFKKSQGHEANRKRAWNVAMRADENQAGAVDSEDGASDDQSPPRKKKSKQSAAK